MKEKSWKSDILFYGFFFVSLVLIVVSQSCNNETTKEEPVCVHIKGEVVAPGYYELEVGSRVKDVILMAGGETQTADLSAVNIARKLVDGEEIVVPGNHSVTTSAKESHLININTADMYQLTKLEGIGESLATAIIAYRVENEGFKTIEEIKNVKGIGDAKFDKIKDNITVE